MPTQNANIPEVSLEKPLDTKVVVASGVTITDRVNGQTFALDASGNVTMAGALTAGSFNNANGFLIRSVATGITAGTTQTQNGATALTKDINNVSNVANDNDGVKLPAAVVGMSIVVNNPSAHTLKVWPATGDDLGAGANTATTQATTVKNVYYCIAANTWVKTS